VATVKFVLEQLRHLRTQTELGPFRVADYENEHLDEPLYALAEAVFRLARSSAGWMATLYLYCIKPTLHLLCGDLINRLLLAWFAWVLSERRLAYYLATLRESLWPNGVWAGPDPPVTPAESARRREALRTTLLNYARTRPGRRRQRRGEGARPDDGISAAVAGRAPVPPEHLEPVVGREIVHEGVARLIDAYQNKRINKRFLLVLIELAASAIFPEMTARANRTERGVTIAHLVRPPPPLPPRTCRATGGIGTGRFV